MADNIVSRINEMPWPVVVTDPAAPNSGDPVRFGSLTGIALLDEGQGGLGATETMVDFGWYVATHPVTDIVGGGIAVGDVVYYDDGADRLENDTTGTPYGIALAVVGAGATTAVNVLHCPAPALGANSVATANIANLAVTQAKIATASLTGLVAAVVADDNVIGGLPVLHRIDVADASANTDVVLTHKTRVIDAWGLNTGIAAHAANDTWQVKNGANAISDAVAKTATVNAVKRIGTIDPATAEIAAGGTLRITAVKDTNAAVTVYVLGIRVA